VKDTPNTVSNGADVPVKPPPGFINKGNGDNQTFVLMDLNNNCSQSSLTSFLAQNVKQNIAPSPPNNNNHLSQLLRPSPITTTAQTLKPKDISFGR